MLSLDEAVRNKQLFLLEQKVWALYPPIEAMPVIRKKFRSVWQVAVLSRRRLAARGIKKPWWQALEKTLGEMGLSLDMEISYELWAMLVLGNFEIKDRELEHMVVSIMRYVNENEVSDWTRYLAETQRDIAKARIEKYRRNQHGLNTWNDGEDEYGLMTFRYHGIIAF